MLLSIWLSLDSCPRESRLKNRRYSPRNAAILLAITILATTRLLAQRETSYDFDHPAWYPHPYMEGGLALNGAGSAPASFNARFGIAMEERHFIYNMSTAYNSARKDNDGTNNNDSGRTRAGGADIFYKFDKWYFGGGAGFGQLSTTNYTKQAFNISFGGGRDFLDNGFRLQVLYSPHAINERTKYSDGSGCRCTNGIQTLSINYWVPSPASSHHLFFHMMAAPYWGHQTVTDPTDPVLTRIQESNRFLSSSVAMNVMYRF